MERKSVASATVGIAGERKWAKDAVEADVD
jgi:hypothetical protein